MRTQERLEAHPGVGEALESHRGLVAECMLRAARTRVEALGGIDASLLDAMLEAFAAAPVLMTAQLLAAETA
jgi:hypothetical protein